MEEKIINRIAEAEDEAAAKRAAAQSAAAEMVAAAERKAAQITKSSEAVCSIIREEGIKTAENKAALDYEQALADSRAEAKDYADGLLANADSYVLEIVGRLAK